MMLVDLPFKIGVKILVNIIETKYFILFIRYSFKMPMMFPVGPLLKER